MNKETPTRPVILVLEDVEETRDGIETLLTSDGYCVEPARDERDAVVRAQRRPPDLILLSQGGPSAAAITAARRVRHDAGLSAEVPVVIFCVEIIDEGAAVHMGTNVYITRPDNFNQLREFIGNLLLRGA